MHTHVRPTHKRLGPVLRLPGASLGQVPVERHDHSRCAHASACGLRHRISPNGPFMAFRWFQLPSVPGSTANRVVRCESQSVVLYAAYNSEQLPMPMTLPRHA